VASPIRQNRENMEKKRTRELVDSVGGGEGGIGVH